MKPYINCKWPGLLVVGQSVTRDQAAEILVRTCVWPMNSNNKKHDEMFNNLISPPKEFKKGLFKINPISLAYLSNDRITTCYIKGPKGWMDWNGRVFTNNYNIGKWPSLQEVTIDWQVIAQNFPFLNLKCQVLDGETCDYHNPTAEWVVRDGQVELKAERPEKLICPIDNDDFDFDLFRKAGAHKKDVERGIELARSRSINNY